MAHKTARMTTGESRGRANRTFVITWLMGAKRTNWLGVEKDLVWSKISKLFFFCY